MKRDMELVRELLLKVEAAPEKPSWKDLVAAADEAEAQRILSHLKLIEEEGFVRSIVVNAGTYRLPQDIELTWKGHEFLNDVRDPEIWRRTKERAKGVASIGVAYMWELAKAEVKARLGLP